MRRLVLTASRALTTRPRRRASVVRRARVGPLAVLGLVGLLSAGPAAAHPPPPLDDGPPAPPAQGLFGAKAPLPPFQLAQPTPPRAKANKRKKNKQRRKGRRGHLSPQERQKLEAEVGRKVDTFVSVELASQLGLDTEKALKLSALLKKRREQKTQARKAARAEYKKLQELLDGGASDSALKAQTRKVVDTAKQAEAPADLLAETSAFLSAQEQARLVLVLPHVHREMRQMMRRARRELRQGRTPERAGFDGLEDDF